MIVALTISPTVNSALDAMQSVRGLVDDAFDIRPFKQPIEDFAYERNAVLTYAHESGYDWALMLDTDERIHCTLTRSELKELLCNTTDDMLHVWADDHSYAKPRLFRLPARGHYKGPTHECWIADPGSTTGTLEGITFSELPKTADQYKAKAERDRDILELYTQEHPDDPRWHYYLGDTYSGLGQDQDAMSSFHRCWDLNGWDEESAWAAYRIAEILCKREKYDLALKACTDGMSRHPGMAELPWLAGYCCFKLGRYQHAIWWEMMALALNGAEAENHRINFRHEPALWEGPYDVLSHAYAALGHAVIAQTDREVCEEIMKRRLDKSRAT